MVSFSLLTSNIDRVLFLASSEKDLEKSRGKTKKFGRISDEAVQKTHKLKGAFHQGVVLVDSFCRIKDLRGESNSLKLAARLALE